MREEPSGNPSVVQVTLDGIQGRFSCPIPFKAVVERLLPEKAHRVLCGLQGGLCVELNQPITADCLLTSVTYQDEEGRRVYERSLRFLFLLSMNRLYPHLNVRILNSIGYGVYLRLLGRDMTREMVSALETDMRNLVERNLPFRRETWSKEDAIRYFEQTGWTDKIDILKHISHEQIIMYRIDGLCEYFYGAMLPSTGYIKTFALRPHFPGLVIQLPSPDNPDMPAPYIPRPKNQRVFAESQRWCHILGVHAAAEVNEMIHAGRMREFIQVNEALHDKSIAAIADTIMAREARVVVIFGPSSSGKTTFAQRLAVHLRVLMQTPKLLSLDDFYKNRADLPVEQDGQPDLENIHALDISCFHRCLDRLLTGQTAQMPRFDFKTGRRFRETYPLHLGDHELLLVEGIHGMNDLIITEIPEHLMYGVYVSALPCINLDHHNRIRTTDVRLLRRIVRDMRCRNTSPMETIAMWPSVRAGEEKWIFPNQEKADIQFNTSLHYELPVLKTIASDMLRSIPHTRPEYLVAQRLLTILHYFLPVSQDVLTEIPPRSILREFIGECAFTHTDRELHLRSVSSDPLL